MTSITEGGSKKESECDKGWVMQNERNQFTVEIELKD